MKIYFTGSITGGRELQPIYKEIIELIKEHGECLTEHIGNAEISSFGEEIDEMAIFERDIAWLKEADVVVAEVTNPSLGAGYEVCFAELNKKPMLCLFNTNYNRRLSGMIRGNKKLVIKDYSTPEELKKIIDEFFSRLTITL